MRRKNELIQLQNELKVNFSDITLLNIAVTHSSYANEKKNIKYNERLEFLGDSVLQLVITKHLFTNYKEKSEGELSKKRSLIVCENSLFLIAQKLNIGKYINMSRGEEITGGRERTSILADCVEAIIAAIYLDQGMNVVEDFILNNFVDTIERAMKNEIILDYKTKLQEIVQKNGDIDIQYNLVKFEGPPHRRKFFTEVQIEHNVLGKGVGYSKKESEQNAAKEAVKHMEENHE